MRPSEFSNREGVRKSIPRGVTIVLAATLLAGTGGHAASNNARCHAPPDGRLVPPSSSSGSARARTMTAA